MNVIVKMPLKENNVQALEAKDAERDRYRVDVSTYILKQMHRNLKTSTNPYIQDTAVKIRDVLVAQGHSTRKQKQIRQVLHTAKGVKVNGRKIVASPRKIRKMTSKFEADGTPFTVIS